MLAHLTLGTESLRFPDHTGYGIIRVSRISVLSLKRFPLFNSFMLTAGHATRYDSRAPSQERTDTADRFE